MLLRLVNNLKSSSLQFFTPGFPKKFFKFLFIYQLKCISSTRLDSLIQNQTLYRLFINQTHCRLLMFYSILMINRWLVLGAVLDNRISMNLIQKFPKIRFIPYLLRYLIPLQILDTVRFHAIPSRFLSSSKFNFSNFITDH